MASKKIFVIIGFVLLLGILALSYWFSRQEGEAVRCQSIRVDIESTDAQHSLMKKADVLRELEAMGIHLIGVPLDSIDKNEIEEKLKENPIFRGAEVYVTPPQGIVQIAIKQKAPFFICQIDKELYYVTESRQLVPAALYYTLDLPMATGELDKEFATLELYDLMKLLQSQPKLYALISQVHYTKGEGIRLSTMLSRGAIILGNKTEWKEAVGKFGLLEDSVMPRIGWNHLLYADLRFKDQIVIRDNRPIREKPASLEMD